MGPGFRSRINLESAGASPMRSWLTRRRNSLLSSKSSTNTMQELGGNSSGFIAPCSKLQWRAFGSALWKLFTGTIRQLFGRKPTT